MATTLNGFPLDLDLDPRVGSSLTLVDGRVSQIVDRSGNEYAYIQNTVANRPNEPTTDPQGLYGIEAQGKNVRRTGSFPFANDINGFLVINVRAVGATAFGGLYDDGVSGATRVLTCFVRLSPQELVYSYGSALSEITLSFDVNTPMVLAFGIIGTTQYFKRLARSESAITTVTATPSVIVTTSDTIAGQLGPSVANNGQVTFARLAAIHQTMTLDEVDAAMIALGREHGVLANLGFFGE